MNRSQAGKEILWSRAHRVGYAKLFFRLTRQVDRSGQVRTVNIQAMQQCTSDQYTGIEAFSCSANSRSTVESTSRRAHARPYRLCMPTPQCVARYTVPRPRVRSNSSSSALWVTDQHLAEAFSRFAGTCRARHGSHVPGPLEARRRANKRKNTTLAAHAGGQTPIDAAVLFGKKSHVGWWSAPTTRGLKAEETPAESALGQARSEPSFPTTSLNAQDAGGPSELRSTEGQQPHSIHADFWSSEWLFGTNVAGPSAKPEIVSGTSNITQPDSATAQEAQVCNPRDFAEALALCKSVDNLEVLVLEHADGTQITHEQASQICDHILKMGWPAHDLAAYITNPTFHPRGSDRRAAVVDHLFGASSLANDSLHQQREAHLQAICEAIRCGTVNEAEWEHMANTILVNRAESISNDEHSKRNYWFHLLIASYRQCPSLDMGFLDQSLARLAAYAPAISELCRLQQSRANTNGPLIAKAYVTRLKHVQSPTEVTALAQSLLTFSGTEQLQLIARVSASLMQAQGKLSSKLPAFRVWRTVLFEVNRLSSTKAAPTKEDVSALSLAISDRGSSIDQLLILAYTISLRYPPPYLHTEEPRSWSLRDILDPADHLLDTPRAALYQELMLRAAAVCLRRYDFSEAVDHILEGHLPELKIQTTNENMAEILRTGALILLHNKKDKMGHKIVSQDLEPLIAALNADMGAFQQLMWSLVGSNKLSHRFLTRTLAHNRPFRTALARSQPKYHNTLNRGALYSAVSPEQALDSINVLAVAFALSNAISPRQAFAKVSWCYYYLKQSRAVVQPPVTQALWHAGVIRYGRACSPRQLLWISERVAEAEGKKIAQRLLNSRSFRVERAKAFGGLVHLAEPQTLRRNAGTQEHLLVDGASTDSITEIAQTIQAQAIALDQQDRKEHMQGQIYRRRITEIRYIRQALAFIGNILDRCSLALQGDASQLGHFDARGRTRLPAHRNVESLVNSQIRRKADNLAQLVTDQEGAATGMAHTVFVVMNLIESQVVRHRNEFKQLRQEIERRKLAWTLRLIQQLFRRLKHIEMLILDLSADVRAMRSERIRLAWRLEWLEHNIAYLQTGFDAFSYERIARNRRRLLYAEACRGLQQRTDQIALLWAEFAMRRRQLQLITERRMTKQRRKRLFSEAFSRLQRCTDRIAGLRGDVAALRCKISP